MRSARSVFILNEAVTFLVILILAFFLVFLFQSHFKNTYIQSQKNNIDKVNLLIDNFLKERHSEFNIIILRGNVDERDYLLNSFSDVYYLDKDIIITRIIKKAGNSNIFKGYDLSKSRAGDFFKTVNSSSGSFSSMFRSPENDTLSLYVAVNGGPVIIAGRISLETFVRLREIREDVKVLLSSGFRNDERIEQAIKMGVQGFLQKPYSMEQFSEAVNKLMG
jgi:DNA-binding NarL/FixJ family response regulator